MIIIIITNDLNEVGTAREAFYVASFVLPMLCRPDSPVSTQDVWNVVRDHYEGTEFDLAVGLASGQPTSTIMYFEVFILRSIIVGSIIS